MSRTNGENCDLVSLFFDGSYEEQVKRKAVIYLLPQKNLTVDFTETSNPDYSSVHTNYYEEDDLPSWNLSITDGEEND